MPQLKQPSSLESIVLQSIQNVVLDLGQQLLAKVCSGVPATVLPTRWGVPSTTKWGVPSSQPPARNKKLVDFSRITMLQPFLHPDLPLQLSDAVTMVVLKAISTLISSAKCTNDAFSKSGDDACRDIVENLTSSALHPRISHLDILQWPWFMGEVLLKHLYKFHHLQVLKLWPGSWSPVWATVVTMLEGDCCTMTNLVSFSMRCHCTDKVLLVLANSTKLQHLDIMSSVEVTDASVGSLLQLRNLKIANIASTAITAGGYVQLLSGLSQISKLVWFDMNGQALKNVRRSQLALNSYEASRVMPEQLNTLVRVCPYLTQVSFHWLETDLSVLVALRYLRDVKLANCNAQDCNLRGLLQVRGCSIVSLELHEVTDVDLLMIGAFCTNVKRLNLVCEFQPPGEHFLPLHVPIFKKLEELMFGSNYSECLFYNCTNLRKLEVSKCAGFNDRVVATLLIKNPLKQLQVLSIVNCGLLSLSTLELLLMSCDNLRVVEGLDSWGGINKLQLAEICSEVKTKNLNIRFVWKKPIQINWS